MLWFVVITAILAAIIWKLFLKQDYWKNKGVVYDNGFPILGTLWKPFFRLEHIVYSIERLYNKFPDKQVVGFYFFGKPSLFIRDPELIKTITVKDFDHFLDHGDFFREDEKGLLAKNLFALKGQRWHEMRSTLSPAFTGSKMKFMFQLISDCGEQVVNYFKNELEKNQNKKPIEVEMKDIMARYTTDVITTAAFGIQVNSFQDKENEFFTMGKASQFTTWRVLLVTIAPKLMKLFGVGLMPKSVIDFVRRVIHENIVTRERDGIIRPDMVHLLMQARKGTLENDSEELDSDKLYGMNTAATKINKKIELTEEDIAAQALVFFIAGFENSATSICFLAHEIAQRPDVQKRLQDEIDEVIGRNGGKFTYQSMQQLKYMDMVLAETYRLWTLAVLLDRVCTKPYTLKTKDGDIHLEVGDSVHFPAFALNRDQKYFPNPMKFDPERFSDENKNDLEKFAYLPFGAGPRICIGQRFVLLETKVILYHLMKNFDMVVTEKTQIPLKLSLNVGFVPEKGFNLGFKLRSSVKTS